MQDFPNVSCLACGRTAILLIYMPKLRKRGTILAEKASTLSSKLTCANYHRLGVVARAGERGSHARKASSCVDGSRGQRWRLADDDSLRCLKKNWEVACDTCRGRNYRAKRLCASSFPIEYSKMLSQHTCCWRSTRRNSA